MVKIKLKYGLPFCSIDVKHNGRILTLDNILIDTGSGGTILKMVEVEKIDISIDVTDSIESIQGVGGSEFVYKKVIDEVWTYVNIVDTFFRNFLCYFISFYYLAFFWSYIT